MSHDAISIDALSADVADADGVNVFSVDVPGYEGPLHLLLELARRQKVNLLQISMLQLAEQYLHFIEDARAKRIDLAADYLLMASWLAFMKSRLLLPRPPKAENGEPEDPRAELVRRLIEYERMKASAARLDEMPRAGRDCEWITVWIADKVVERQPEVSLHDLQVAWLSLMKQARVHQHHKIHREELSVREHMSIILRRLRGGGYVVFDQLFDLTLGAQGLVVSFLALLELARESLIEITQNEAMAPIYVKLPDAATV